MRKLIVLVAAFGMVFALSTPAEAARKFRVKISISSSSVMVGQQVTISGTAAPKASGRKVTLYQRFSGKKWKREASSRVRSNGTFRFTDTPTKRKTRQYRVIVAKGGKYRAGTSRAVRLKVSKARKTTPQVSVSAVSSRSIEAGQTVTVTGRVTRTMAGRYAQLQVGPGGAWGRVGAARIASDGTFSVSAAITQSGSAVPLRVLVPASKFNHAVAADAGAVKVYGWHYLQDLESLEDDWTEGVFSISGQTYPRSIAQDGYDRTPQVNLGRACTQFVATLGVSDLAGDTTEWATSLFADAVSKYSRTGIRLGQSHPVAIDVTGALRLRFDSQFRNDDGDLVWGDARILCAF